jgi:uncharacterized protein
MSVSVIDAALRNLADYMNRNSDCAATLLWHGGEPMLMGESFYRKVLELHRTVMGDWATHVMQSNLTLADKSLLGLLSELLNGGGIGTSLDPFSDYRGLKNGQSYLQRWYEGYELAKGLGFRVGMVYVVHGRSVGIGKKIYHYFKNLGLDSLTLIPLEEPAGLFAGPRLDAHSWGVFLTEVYAAWERDHGSLPVEPFVNWFGGDSPEDAFPASHTESLNCCEPTLAISPEGDVYACVRQLDIGAGRIGNIVSDPVERLLAHPDAWWRSRRRELIRRGECGSCRWWRFCAGGCAAASGTCHRTVWCEGYQLFFEALHG